MNLTMLYRDGVLHGISTYDTIAANGCDRFTGTFEEIVEKITELNLSGAESWLDYIQLYRDQNKQ